MFWDNVACVYDVFANVINRKTNEELCSVVKNLILPEYEVLECACGTGLLTKETAQRCKSLVATDFPKKCWSEQRKSAVNMPTYILKKRTSCTLIIPIIVLMQ